jgi:hypothetical protein
LIEQCDSLTPQKPKIEQHWPSGQVAFLANIPHSPPGAAVADGFGVIVSAVVVVAVCVAEFGVVSVVVAVDVVVSVVSVTVSNTVVVIVTVELEAASPALDPDPPLH